MRLSLSSPRWLDQRIGPRYSRPMQSPGIDVEAQARAGIAALQRGDLVIARDLLEQAASAAGATPQLWLLLAQACNSLDDRPATHRALDQVLEADPLNPFPLLMKGDLHVRDGDDRAAVSYYRMAIRSSERLQQLPGDLPQRLDRAAAAVAASEERFRHHLSEQLGSAGIDPIPARMAEAIAIASGAQPVYLQQPTSFYYPGLPQVAWFEREQFPWLADMESAVPAMRAEIEGVLAEDRGLVPYVEQPENRASRGHSLLNDARWSAFHLWQDGEQVEDNAARCPTIMKILESAPMPQIKQRSPMALISILKPGTHIEPHTGMLNTRLICHIPLVVPDGCRLRVGAETRIVEEGKAMIFDDSIEHEAWNDGRSARAVLLFEFWRPELDAAERDALTVMFEAISGYSAGPA